MSVNNPTLFQASTLLNEIVAQATGQKNIAAASVGDFVSVATTAIKTGYDPILNAMSQVLNRTIVAVRPYKEKYASLYNTAERWGNITRKVSFVDSDVVDDGRFAYPAGYDSTQDPATGNGLSVDMYKLAKPEVLQTCFYGQSVFEDDLSIFRDSLDVAFRDPEEFMRFTSGIMTNRYNKLAQYRENIGRGLILNLMGSLYYIANAVSPLGDSMRVVHLLTEYNTETGKSLTTTTVMDPDNYPAFMRWVYARIGTLADMFTERTSVYQTTINGKTVRRHTDAEDLRLFVLSKYLRQMDSMARAVTFHENLLELAEVESIAYWQDIKTPDQISLANTISLTGADGSVIETALALSGTLSNVFGIMFDRDAAGYAVVNEWSAMTPFNTKGGYWNEHVHVNFRTRQDTTEKSVLLLLD